MKRRIFELMEICFLLGLFLTASAAADVGGDVNRANRVYRKGDYAAAVKRYEKAAAAKPQSQPIFFDLGTALYKKGEYDNAVQNLRQALLTEDNKLKEKTQYNLGNALFKSGKTLDYDNPNKTQELWKEAIAHYDGALELNPQNVEAKFNKEIVVKELKRLQVKQQQQKQQQQQQQSDQKSEDQSKSVSERNNQDQKDKKSHSAEQQKPSEANQGKKTEQGKEQPKSKAEEAKPESSAEQKKADQTGAKSDQKGGNKKPEDYNNQTAVVEPGALTPREAQKLVDGYLQKEAPAGMLNLDKHQGKTAPVTKDW
ncbi:MAG: tetratricopeptide repeat protein [Candidatus Omnitrophica bacterium]|nr:tetratricopeptide repeat protein [Candidatus Omnitrophota bacterium]